jgi:hypothetical protein
MTRRSRTDRELVKFANHALRGLAESRTFIGVWGDDIPMDGPRVEFLLQLGYALMNDKFIIIPVPHGVELPKKVEAIADAVVRYNRDDPESLQHALTPVLTRLAVKKH